MNRTFLMALASTALFGLGNARPTAADGGHNHGSSNGKSQKREYSAPALPQIDSRSRPIDRLKSRLPEQPLYRRPTPFGAERQAPFAAEHGRQPLPRCRGGQFSFPGRAGPIGHNRDILNTAAPRGAGRNSNCREVELLAFQLGFTAEIVFEDLRFEFARTRGAEGLFRLADAVNQQTQHFHMSLLEGAEPDHLRRDLNNVSDAVDGLSRSLSRFHGNTSTGRGVARLQRIASAMESQLQDRKPVVNQRRPLERQPLGTDHRRSAPEPLVIPPEAKGIALLSPDDQRAALAQKTCPVTGDRLGADGRPLKVQLGGRTVFVCCESCVEDLKANPDEYLADG